MAAEAQAESPPGPVPPPPPACGSFPASSSEKRALTGPAVDGEEEGEEEQRLPEPKRRQACVAALDSVPSAAAEAEAEGAGGSGSDGAAPFSFQHARGGFLAPETTPKFGSFNPPGEDDEPAALDLKPAQHGAGGEGSLESDDKVPSASAGGAADNDESAQVVGGEVDGQVQIDEQT